MKRSPLIDNSVTVPVEHGALFGRLILVCDKPPRADLTDLPTGSIAIRRDGGYTTHLGVGGGRTRAWYALASEYVGAASDYLKHFRPDVYRTISWIL